MFCARYERDSFTYSFAEIVNPEGCVGAFQRFLHFGRRSGGKNVRGDFNAFADHAARGDQRAFTDDAAVEERCIAADQRVVFDVAILHDGRVPNRYVVPHERLTRFADVNHGVVLNRGAGADANWAVVAAKHGAEPDAGLFADFDVADQDGSRSHEGGRMNFGPLAPVLDDHTAKLRRRRRRT